MTKTLAAAAAVALTALGATRVEVAAAPAEPIAAFWRHWSDGRAEVGGYRLVQPRYGEKRAGTAVLIFVTEDFSDSLRVKADPGKHPPSDVYPVLKLNALRHFQTGIYDYSVMTSTFARVAPGWPIAKVSFTSQEWCGHVYHHLLPRAGRAPGIFHSYFDGEADGTEDLAFPEGGVMEDALPILVRGWVGRLLAPGEARAVPFLPSLLRARLEHRRLAWGRATVSVGARPEAVAVPAGRFEAERWTIAEEGGRVTRMDVEAAPPHRVLRWTVDTGESAELVGSDRLTYWELNREGGEKYLKRLGLGVRPPARKMVE